MLNTTSLVTRHLELHRGNKTQSQEIYCSERNYINKLVDVKEYLVVLKRELYTLRWVRELYANIKGVRVDSIQTIDIKNLIEKRLEGKV